MIEGLKVTVTGVELRDLASARADYHAERTTVYAGQIANFKASNVEGMPNMTNGDPTQALESRRLMHDNSEKELRFIASHIDPIETYLLERDALERLGIIASRY